MDNLKNTLKNAWNERFGEDFRTDQREVKTLKSPQGQKLCQVVYSKKLEEWYRSPAGKARYEKPQCFFCEMHDEYDILKKVLGFGHLDIYFNLKFVAPGHFLIAPPLEHREHPGEGDIIVLQDLACQSGLSIFGNFRDSGASYPEHIHYQSLGIVFLITKKPAEEIFSNEHVKVKRIKYPIAAFRLSQVNTEGLKLIGTAIPLLSHPFNLLFYKKDIFLIPRTKSVPFNTKGFKFAAAEICGCVFTRTREMYESFDFDLMLAALRDVCFPFGSQLAENYEERIIEVIKEVSHEI